MRTMQITRKLDLTTTADVAVAEAASAATTARTLSNLRANSLQQLILIKEVMLEQYTKEIIQL